MLSESEHMLHLRYNNLCENKYSKTILYLEFEQSLAKVIWNSPHSASVLCMHVCFHMHAGRGTRTSFQIHVDANGWHDLPQSFTPFFSEWYKTSTQARLVFAYGSLTSAKANKGIIGLASIEFSQLVLPLRGVPSYSKKWVFLARV